MGRALLLPSPASCIGEAAEAMERGAGGGSESISSAANDRVAGRKSRAAGRGAFCSPSTFPPPRLTLWRLLLRGGPPSSPFSLPFDLDRVVRVSSWSSLASLESPSPWPVLVSLEWDIRLLFSLPPFSPRSVLSPGWAGGLGVRRRSSISRDPFRPSVFCVFTAATLASMAAVLCNSEDALLSARWDIEENVEPHEDRRRLARRRRRRCCRLSYGDKCTGCFSIVAVNFANISSIGGCGSCVAAVMEVVEAR